MNKENHSFFCLICHCHTPGINLILNLILMVWYESLLRRKKLVSSLKAGELATPPKAKKRQDGATYAMAVNHIRSCEPSALHLSTYFSTCNLFEVSLLPMNAFNCVSNLFIYLSDKGFYTLSGIFFPLETSIFLEQCASNQQFYDCYSQACSFYRQWPHHSQLDGVPTPQRGCSGALLTHIVYCRYEAIHNVYCILLRQLLLVCCVVQKCSSID